MSIEKKIYKFKKDLDLFDNDLDKYEYIIDLGKELKEFNEINKKDENLVLGCTSKVWLICEKDEKGRLIFSASSDAMIVKGLVYILINIFSGLTPKEILEVDINLLKQLNLTEIITPNRQSGVVGMIKRIKEYATAFSKKE